METDIQYLQLKNLCQLVKQNRLTHSIMLISKDDFALKYFSTQIAKMLMCNNLIDLACDKCVQCKKIEHHNHADVLTFPVEKTVIATEEMLQIIDSVFTMPFESDKKIYILNNAGSINAIAQNKLLKTLEEPPKGVYFILNVKNQANILPTIKSRCTKIYIENYSNNKIIEYLNQFNLLQEQIADIVDVCDGSMELAHNYAQNSSLLELIDFVYDLWLNLKHSSQIVQYSSRIYKLKNVFENFLNIFNIILKKVLECKFNIILHENRLVQLQQIAQDFSVEALSKIAKNLVELNEKFQRNCNFNIIIDVFLISFLEVKNKCQ